MVNNERERNGQTPELHVGLDIKQFAPWKNTASVDVVVATPLIPLLAVTVHLHSPAFGSVIAFVVSSSLAVSLSVVPSSCTTTIVNVFVVVVTPHSSPHPVLVHSNVIVTSATVFPDGNVGTGCDGGVWRHTSNVTRESTPE